MRFFAGLLFIGAFVLIFGLPVIGFLIFLMVLTAVGKFALGDK